LKTAKYWFDKTMLTNLAKAINIVSRHVIYNKKISGHRDSLELN